MKRYIRISCALALATLIWSGCTKKFPVEGDGLLITNRTECYVSNFDLLGSTFVSVISGDPVIDTVAQTVQATVFYGTDLKNLYPQFSLPTDCILTPAITGKTDFSDTTNPRKYTVVSGNRKVKKTYTVFISMQHP